MEAKLNWTLKRILIVRPDDSRFFSQSELHGASEFVFDQTPLLRKRWFFASSVGIPGDPWKNFPLGRNEQCYRPAFIKRHYMVLDDFAAN